MCFGCKKNEGNTSRIRRLTGSPPKKMQPNDRLPRSMAVGKKQHEFRREVSGEQKQQAREFSKQMKDFSSKPSTAVIDGECCMKCRFCLPYNVC